MTTRHVRRRELDRNTWSSNTTVVLDYVTKGSGSFLTPALDFGVRFSGPPYVSFGAVLSDVGSLTEGDYPFLTVGVAEWITLGSSDIDVSAGALIEEHIGAKLWISVSSRTAYEIVHSLKFEGLAMKTPLVNR